MIIEAKPAKKRKGIYKYITREDILFKEKALNAANIPFDEDFLKITAEGYIVVKGSHQNGYAWDGCTPKLNIFDIALLGVPDGRTLIDSGKPITYYASMVHDILCQYQHKIGITRKQADEMFLFYLGSFNLKYVYYFAVRAYGMYLDLKSSIIHMKDKI